jgi:cytidylate kinase
MSIPVPRDLVEKAVKSFQSVMQQKHPQAAQQTKRMITISRQPGSGGERITELLRQWLEWPVWDKEILDVLASQSHLGYQKKMFEAVDEKIQDEIESLVSLTLGHIDKNAYLYLLPKAIFLISQHDAIIIGRGAHLFLPESLKVRIKASFSVRVENIMRREGLPRKEAQEKIRAIDQEREAFIKELCRRLKKPYTESKNHLHYDLEISTDTIHAEEAALLILIAAMKKFDLKIDLGRVLRDIQLS